MEGGQTPPIEYVTLDLPPSNEDLDEIGVAVLPSSSSARGYNSVPPNDPDTPLRMHPLNRTSLPANPNHSTSQYQQQRKQQQQPAIHGRGGIEVDYSIPSSLQQQQQQQQRLFDSAAAAQAEQPQKQQQQQPPPHHPHHSSSQRLNEVGAASPHETGSGTVLLSSSSPNSVVSYANMPATNSNFATTDQDSDTTQARSDSVCGVVWCVCVVWCVFVIRLKKERNIERKKRVHTAESVGNLTF